MAAAPASARAPWEEPANVHPIQPPLQHAAPAAKIIRAALAGIWAGVYCYFPCMQGTLCSLYFKKIIKNNKIPVPEQ
jgi:hypothetical protein